MEELHSLFAGEESFDKFTDDIVKQFMKEEELRAHHQVYKHNRIYGGVGSRKKKSQACVSCKAFLTLDLISLKRACHCIFYTHPLFIIKQFP